MFVVGPSQAGKSSLCQSALPGYAYITLDDVAALSAAKEAPDSFAENLTANSIIDEIQRAPELVLAIKAGIARNQQPGRFVLIGSADGRRETLALYPLSRREIDRLEHNPLDTIFDAEPRQLLALRNPVEDFLPHLLTGGYPDAVQRRQNARRRSEWFASYVSSVVNRDATDISNVSNPEDLYRLLRLMATRAANLLDISGVSNELKMPRTTTDRYLTLLERLFLIVRLPAYLNNPGMRLIKSPKVHLIDTGLLCHLAQYGEERLRSDRTFLCHVLENYVVMECLKNAGWSKYGLNLYHWRKASGTEVDLVIEREDDGSIIGIEVKAFGEATDRDFRSLRELQNAAGAKFHRGFVVHTGQRAYGFGDKLYSFPISWLV